MAKKQMVTVAEAAQIAGKAERTIRKACLEGDLSARKENGAWTIEKSSIKEYLRELARAEKARKGGK